MRRGCNYELERVRNDEGSRQAVGCELYVGQSALQAGPSPRGRKDRRYLADPGRRSEARGRPYLERKVYRREPATPEIPEKMRSPLLHSASLCTPAASRSGRWLCDRDEALRCYIRRRAGCLCDPELRSAALSCLWGYHVRPWDQTASCDKLGWRVSLVSAASMAVPSLSELSPRAPGLHGPAAPL